MLTNGLDNLQMILFHTVPFSVWSCTQYNHYHTESELSFPYCLTSVGCTPLQIILENKQTSWRRVEETLEEEDDSSLCVSVLLFVLVFTKIDNW